MRSFRFLTRGLRAAVVLCLAAAAAPASVALAECCGFERRDDFPSKTRVRFELPGGGRLLPERLVLSSRAGAAQAAELPRWATPVAEDRAPLADVPLAGAIFDARPYIDIIEEERPVGSVHRLGDDLLVLFNADRKVAPPRDAAAALVIREPKSRRVASLTLTDLAFRPVGPLGEPGPRIGSAYVVEGRLVLAPPLKSLRGFNLF